MTTTLCFSCNKNKQKYASGLCEVCHKAAIETSKALKKTRKPKKARLDPKGTAEPRTRIVHHPDIDMCISPGMRLVNPEYEDEKGRRTALIENKPESQDSPIERLLDWVGREKNSLRKFYVLHHTSGYRVVLQQNLMDISFGTGTFADAVKMALDNFPASLKRSQNEMVKSLRNEISRLEYEISVKKSRLSNGEFEVDYD